MCELPDMKYLAALKMIFTTQGLKPQRKTGRELAVWCVLGYFLKAQQLGTTNSGIYGQRRIFPIALLYLDN